MSEKGMGGLLRPPSSERHPLSYLLSKSLVASESDSSFAYFARSRAGMPVAYPYTVRIPRYQTFKLNTKRLVHANFPNCPVGRSCICTVRCVDRLCPSSRRRSSDHLLRTLRKRCADCVVLRSGSNSRGAGYRRSAGDQLLRPSDHCLLRTSRNLCCPGHHRLLCTSSSSTGDCHVCPSCRRSGYHGVLRTYRGRGCPGRRRPPSLGWREHLRRCSTVRRRPADSQYSPLPDSVTPDRFAAVTERPEQPA